MAAMTQARLAGMMAAQYGTPKAATLARAICRTFGADWPSTMRDVCRGGADAGFPGFCYYSETVAFFRRHRAAICAMVEAMADDMGEDPVATVATFQCLTDDRETREAAARCLYGGRLTDECTTVANALAWFALETTARMAGEG